MFSLLAIGGNNRRTANIRSKGYSTLFVLSKEDLNDVIRDYPDAQQLLKRKARKMLKKDETKTEVDPKQARLNLKEKCRISTDIKTPKMLEAVAKLLPSSSPVKKELDKVLERESFYCILKVNPEFRKTKKNTQKMEYDSSRRIFRCI